MPVRLIKWVFAFIAALRAIGLQREVKSVFASVGNLMKYMSWFNLCTSNCPQSTEMKAAAAGIIVTDWIMAASKHLIRFWGSWVCCRPDQTRMFHKFCMSLLTAKKKKKCTVRSWLCITWVSLGYKCRSFAVAAAVCSHVPPRLARQFALQSCIWGLRQSWNTMCSVARHDVTF